jgi:1-carboxybiuret hydrolase
VTTARPPGAGFFAAHTVAGLAAELRGGRRTPIELVDHALAAAARLQPSLNAFVTIDEPGARAAARRATDELAAGRDRGPLHGIPVAVKDLLDTAGLRTTMGSRHFADHVPERDAECVRRLREAGAVVVGKTVTHEFAYGPTGDRSASGPARNPYRTTAMSGGSSAGSAVAVAAGIVPLAVGTDTGGSVRIPAACCGIAGLRPTSGAVPADGMFPLSPTLDAVGALARTVADCRLLWQVLSGDTATTEAPARVRIGWVAPETFHPAEAAVTRAAREQVAGAGAVSVPRARELLSAYRLIQSGEVYAIHAERVATAPELFGEELLARLEVAGQVRGWEYVRAVENRRRAIADIPRLFADHDLLALPTIPITAPPIDARNGRIGDTEIDIRAALLSLTSPWSVLGLPALSVPAGLVDGLPVGLQLVAPAGGEDLLLRVAEDLGQRPVR